MKGHQKLQHFAVDSEDNIIDIHDIAGAIDYTLYCPCCHEEVIRKCGNIRQWHFAHKAKKCSYDTYLHSVAERLIMDWFKKKESITLKIDGQEKCDKYNSCLFYNHDGCSHRIDRSFDLKKYYSKCIREHKYKNFVADLFCQRDSNEETPIFIEIYVTHRCSSEKINSGIRIIEIEIQSEEDILDITNHSTLAESAKVQLFNFKRPISLTEKFDVPFQKFILFSSLKSYIDKQSFTCKNYAIYRKGIYEISMPYDDCLPYFIDSGGLYTVGKVKSYLDGVLPKTCEACKWQKTDMLGNKFCVLYKKCGNPKYCKDNDEIKCEMFKPNKHIIESVIYDFDKISSQSHIDIWAKEPLIKQGGTK